MGSSRDSHNPNQSGKVRYFIFSFIEGKCITEKNAYALKTPHVVALPFIYGVECIQFHTLLATLKNVF